MRTGMSALTLLVLVALLPAQSLAADPPIVYQTQPLGRLLDELRAQILAAAGPNAVAEFNKSLKRSLGEKGFSGFDITRPIVGYVSVPGDLAETVAVIAFPISGEKEWVDFCERWNKSKLKAPKDGIYEVPPLGPGLKSAMRIVDGYAYVAAAKKDPARALAPEKLVPFAKLFDGNDASLMSGRVQFDRLPKNLRAKVGEALKQFKASLPNLGAEEKKLVEPFFTLASRYLNLIEGAREATLQANLDRATGLVAAELTITPRSGSALEKHLAGLKPTMNRFAGLSGPNDAASFRIHLPLDIPEIQSAAVMGLEKAQKEMNNNIFAPLKGVISELLKGSIRTVKTGEVDVAAVLRGPNKNGAFTAIGGLAFDDPSAFEKELKKAIDDLAPSVIKNSLKWDAQKVGKVGIHTVALHQMPENLPRLKAAFGQEVMLAFAFAPKAAYVAMGPGDEPVEAIKKALAAKPGPAPMLELAYNPDKIVKLVATLDPPSGAFLGQVFGKQKTLATAWMIDVGGGKQLKIRYAQNLKLMFGWLVPSRSAGSGASEAPFAESKPRELKK